LIRPRTRLALAALIGIAAQVALSLSVWAWADGASEAATAGGVAIAVLAGAAGGVVPGLVVAGAGWLLNVALVADWSLSSLLALPAWLVAGGAAGFLVTRWWQRSRGERLAASRLSAIREAASDAILRIDADGSIAAWSAGAEALYGYSSAEIVGRPLADLLGGPDAAELADRLVESVRAGQQLNDVMEHRARDGRVFSASVTITPSPAEDEADEPVEAVIVARDIGETRRITDRLRDTEARYRSLTQHLPVVT
jgi:PAS domain S-box-containing protein